MPRSGFHKLIEDKAQGDNNGWGKVWHLVLQLVIDTWALMPTRLLSGIAIRHTVSSLLILPQKKPNEVCERRAEVARGLLAKEA